MTSMDSGVETGNDSNDSSAAQHDNATTTIQVNGATTTAVCDPTATTSQTEEQKQQSDKEKEPGKNFRLVRAVNSIDVELPIFFPVLETFRSTESNQCSTGASTSSPLPLLPYLQIASCKWDLWWCDTNGRQFSPPLFEGSSTIYHTKMKTSQMKNSVRRYHKGTSWKEYQDKINERKMRLAAATNNIELMTRLLNQGISPNSHDELGRTPLHYASCRGYAEMVKLLLDHNADPNQKDGLGTVPLHLAVIASKISVVLLLLNAGTDILSSDKLGYNPVQLAQTKLKMLQTSKGSAMEDVKREVQCVVSILLLYLKRQKDAREEVEALSNFCSRLSLSNTTEQIQDDLRDLLSSIDSLRITS